MIAACYTTHLYCDCRECKGETSSYINPEFGEYIGESWAETARNARQDGWRISKDRERAYAPGHKIPRRNNEKESETEVTDG